MNKNTKHTSQKPSKLNKREMKNSIIFITVAIFFCILIAFYSNHIFTGLFLGNDSSDKELPSTAEKQGNHIDGNMKIISIEEIMKEEKEDRLLGKSNTEDEVSGESSDDPQKVSNYITSGGSSGSSSNQGSGGGGSSASPPPEKQDESNSSNVSEKIEIDETELINKVKLLYRPQLIQRGLETNETLTRLTQFTENSSSFARCGTPVLLEVFKNWNELSNETKETLQVFMQRPTLPLTHSTTHFVIHYTDTGPNAVTFNYVQSLGNYLENSWNTEVNSFGFNQPVDSLIDVFVFDIVPPAQIKWNPWNLFGVVEMEWDISNSDNLNKVSAAHEFFHAVEIAYDWWMTEKLWVIEGTAMWMEDAVYDNVNVSDDDNKGNHYDAAVWDYFWDTDESLYTEDGTHEYAMVIFWKYFSENFGTNGAGGRCYQNCNDGDCGVDIIEALWDKTITYNDIDTVEQVLIDWYGGGSWQSTFLDWLIANYAKDFGDPYGTGWYDYCEDEEESYDSVYRAYEYTLNGGDHITVPYNSVSNWSSDYINISPSSSVGKFTFSFNGDNSGDFLLMVLFLSWDTNYDIEMIYYANLDANNDATFTYPNDDYDRVMVIVSGRYNGGSYNLGIDGLLNSPGESCSSDSECSSGSCEGSQSYSARCCSYSHPDDGWYGGGDSGCCTWNDPTSYYRDYYCDSNGNVQYENTNSQDCDSIDGWYGYGDAGPGCSQMNDLAANHRDYYVVQNTGVCSSCNCESIDCDNNDGWYGGGNTQQATCGQADNDASSQRRDYYVTGSLSSVWCTSTTTNCPSQDCDSSDGWYGGGNTAGCGDDPSSYWRDYHVISDTGSCTYTTSCSGTTNYKDCDNQDICTPFCQGNSVVFYEDYYVMSNTNVCLYSTGFQNCGSDTCSDSGDSWTVKDYIIDYEGCSNGACGTDETRYDYCSGDTVYDRQCGTSDESTAMSYNCNNYDTSKCWCTVGSTLSEVCDDWLCNNGACTDSASDWTRNTWSCNESNECGTQGCGGPAYTCYRTNAGNWNWALSAESTEENCNDGYDNDCDGSADGVDLDCPGCTPGETSLCPRQQGVCTGTYQTCTAQGEWPGCDDSTYLAWNSSYENPETSCDNLDNDCDGNVDGGFTNEDCQYVCQNSGYVWTDNGGNLNCCGNDANEDNPYEATESTCDDGNDNDCDGYADMDDMDCISCVTPTDGMTVTGNTYFCQGTYNLPNGISIGADNIVLECNGSVLNGSGSGTGITLADADNNVLRNCTVTNYQYGIYFYSPSTNNNIYNSTFCGNGYDITDYGSNGGDDNTCEVSYNWNDAGATGCTYSCTGEMIRGQIEYLLNLPLFDGLSSFNVCMIIPSGGYSYAYEAYKDGLGVHTESIDMNECYNESRFDFVIKFVDYSNFLDLYNNPVFEEFKNGHAVDYYFWESRFVKSNGIVCDNEFYGKYCGFLNGRLNGIELLFGGMWCCVSYEPGEVVKIDDSFDYEAYYGINITSDHITLDCNENEITSSNGFIMGTGILLNNRDNVTIKDCDVYGYETGIHVNESSGINLFENYVHSNSHGIILSFSSNTYVYNNTMCGNENYDILDGDSSSDENTCDFAQNWNDTGTVTGCTYSCMGCRDDDGDGYNATGGVCGPVDCNDSSTSVYPGATEVCNGVDDDCDGITDDGMDDVCDDSVYCNGQETCGGASGCQAGTPVDCSYLDDQCNDGYCDEENDQCKKDPTPYEGLSCNDGLFCNLGETCQGGDCIGGQARDCSDDVGCTDDSCDEGNDQCVSTVNDANCDDGLWCNGFETCDAVNGCHPGTPADCSYNSLPEIATCTNDPDNNPFTWDYFEGFASICNEDTDACTTGSYSFTHTCDKAQCSAECEQDNDCGPHCVSDMKYYSGTCSYDCSECSYSSEDCNDYDANNCWCTAEGTLSEICDDWTCGDGECGDSGSDWTRNIWSCGSSNECGAQDCGGTTYKCYRTNGGSWNWSLSAESTESNCEDGYDNDCDGLADALDPECPAPDLTVVSAPVYPENPVAGEYLVVEVTLQNIGEVASDNVYWEIDTGSADPNPKSTEPISLGVNQKAIFNVGFVYEEKGTYSASVIADPNDVVEESNEDNNVMNLNLNVI